MNLSETKNKMNKLCQDLIEVIDKVKSGELTIAKATAISKLASNAIKATTGVAITLQHHEIQMQKIIMRGKELEFKHKELDNKIKSNEKS